MFKLDKENEKAPLAEVTFEKGKYAGQAFRSELVPCRELTCECGNIYVDFTNGEEKYTLWLDTYSEEVDTMSEEEPVQEFTEHLAEELLEEDWRELHALYYVFKVAGTELVEPGEILVNFDEEEVEEGVMVNYNALLPYGFQVRIKLGDTDYGVDTLFCVRSNCRCTAINLVFYPEKDGEEPEDVQSTTIYYDYASGKYAVESPGVTLTHSPEALMNGLKERLPELKSFLKERHKRLKTLYRNYLKREGLEPGVPKAVVLPGEATKPKVGRNEPCACGSGKKYKKCCGA